MRHSKITRCVQSGRSGQKGEPRRQNRRASHPAGSSQAPGVNGIHRNLLFVSTATFWHLFLVYRRPVSPPSQCRHCHCAEQRAIPPVVPRDCHCATLHHCPLYQWAKTSSPSSSPELILFLQTCLTDEHLSCPGQVCNLLVDRKVVVWTPFNKTMAELEFLAIKEPELCYCWAYEVFQLLVCPRDTSQLFDVLRLEIMFSNALRYFLANKSCSDLLKQLLPPCAEPVKEQGGFWWHGEGATFPCVPQDLWQTERPVPSTASTC